MGYKHRKRNAATKSKILRKRPTASTQKYQILDLNKRVNDNSRKLRDLTFPVFNWFGASRQNLTSLWNFVSLYDVSTFQPVFQETPVGSLTPKIGKCRITKMSVEFEIQAGSEAEACNWTMFVVTPKNQKVAEECASGTGDLTNLIGGLDYVEVNGLIFMNKKRWNIRYYRKGTTQPLPTNTYGDVPGTIQRYISDQRPVRGKFTLHNPLKLESRTGNWRDIGKNYINHNQRYTMLIFNNNTSALEGSPWFTYSALVKGIQSQPYQQ